MGRVGDNTRGMIPTQLVNIVREISALPKCRSTSRNMWSSLLRRVRMMSSLFEELLDRQSEREEDEEVNDEKELLELGGEVEFSALQSLWDALNSAKELHVWVNDTSKIYQAIHRNPVSAKFLKATEEIEEALTAIHYDRLNLPEEVQEAYPRNLLLSSVTSTLDQSEIYC